jgi:pimeloyl-ACP methyl ester carboxylesterase
LGPAARASPSAVRGKRADILPRRMAFFVHDGQRLGYTVYGEGPRTCVLVPGLLLSQRMHVPLARTLAERGNRVITFDPLGHGVSDRPEDMWRYSMTAFAEQVVALMNHLDLEQTVVGGTSLGANVTLEVASIAGDRLRGMLIEMPVLDGALIACAVAFTPLMVALTVGEPAMRGLQRVARAIPRDRLPLLVDIGLDWARQDPAPSAAVLEGLFFGRTAPHRSERRTFEAPALVIGHPRDPIHPFSDAGMLAEELPNGRLLDANSIFELRIWPERLTNEIAGFLDECWRPRRARGAASRGGTRRPARRTGGQRASAR